MTLVLLVAAARGVFFAGAIIAQWSSLPFGILDIPALVHLGSGGTTVSVRLDS